MGKNIHSNRERELLRRATRVLPQGTLGNLDYDRLIKRGKGSHIWDESDNEYIDYLLGSGPMIVGHAHPEVNAAVEEQIDLGTTFFATNEKSILLAEEIIKAVPCAEKVRYCSTGSEATLYAMRVARAFRSRDKILKFEGGFHGMNDYALMSMSPKRLFDFPKSEPDSAGIPKSLQSEVLIAPFNNIDMTSEIIKSNHDDIGGVIVEPFQRLIPPKPGFLEGLREVTEKYEIPLIFDEIVTGFRFSYGGAQEYYGVTPDICTLGKSVAGGFPLTAVAGKTDIMDHFDIDKVSSDSYLLQLGTLSGNPVAASAGLATLKILRRKGIYEQIFDTGRKVMTGLQDMLDAAEIPAQVIGEPVLFDVFFTNKQVSDYRTSLHGDMDMLNKFNELLLEEGIFKAWHHDFILAAAKGKSQTFNKIHHSRVKERWTWTFNRGNQQRDDLSARELIKFIYKA